MIAEIFKRERFANVATSQAFAAHSNERKFQARRVFLFVGAITFASYSLLDYLVAGDNWTTFVALRLSIITPIMLIVSCAFWAGHFEKRENLAFVIYFTPVVLSIIYMCSMLEEASANVYPYGMLVIALFMSMLMLPTFRFTALLVAQVMCGLFIVTIYSQASMEGVYTLYFFVSLACVVLLVGMFFLENTERSQYTYKRELEKTISTLRESEQRAVALYHEAKKAEKAQSEFLAVVSHELRTPMNAIIGFSEIISKGMLGTVKPPQYQEYALHINDSGKQLLVIINDLLDVSRAEMDKMSFEHRAFDITETVQAAITSCRGNGTKTSVTVIQAEPRLQQVEIEGDEARLLQAMTNIIGNAIKFSRDRGMVTVDLYFTQLGELRFSATDDGIGISDEDIEQIRQPFRQAESAFARKNGGLGLGLAICNIVANAHNGTLHIESTLGKGTTVSITLPPGCVLSTTETQMALAN